jgi:thiamine kinase-like enzyme
VRAEAIAERVWPGQPVEVEPLGGGITNHNFKVVAAGEAFVLRIGGERTELLGIDRRAEHAAASIAAELGVGPNVVAFVEPEGSLVTEFIVGEPAPVEEMRRPETLREVAGLLRRMHEGPPFPARFDSFRVVEIYRETAAAHGVEPPPAYREAKLKADQIERRLGRRPLAPCHNDLLNANFIRGLDGRLRIVDWEYAGMGDRFFDVANFAVNHGLDADGDTVLLDAYAGRPSDEQIAHLRLMRFMSDFREAMWGVVQQAVSQLDFDFEGYARHHFERLERTAADPGFQEALA